MRKLETQILIDENTTDVFWGKGEDVEGIQVGDELQLVSLKQKKPRRVPRTKYVFVVEGYHHMEREHEAKYPEQTQYYKSLGSEIQTLYRNTVDSIWSGGQNRSGIPQRRQSFQRSGRVPRPLSLSGLYPQFSPSLG